MLLCLAWLQPGLAEDLSENQIKSAYVLNFVKFVEWPPETLSADEKITLCAVGNNVLDGALFSLNGRKIGGRELHIVPRIYADDNLAGCQVAFIGKSEERRIAAIIKALGDSPVLAISDIADFAEKGGSIGLLYRENKIVFEVNLTSTKRAKLRLPGQLLKLASYIFGK